MAYSQKEKENIIEEICDRIANNGESVRNILKDDHMPNYVTFFRWVDADEAKRNQYARAMEVRAEKMAEELLNICDATENDIIINDEGFPVTNHNVIQRDRLRLDTRKWLMSKMFPKKYGDYTRQEHDIRGGLDLSELNINIIKSDNNSEN